MQIDIPKIVELVDLGGYAPELAGTNVYAWINPPRGLLNRYFELTAQSRQALKAVQATQNEAEQAAVIEQVKQAGQGIAEWLAGLWSQGPDGTHWTPDEIHALANSDTDPQLYGWLLNATWERIDAHREHVKKKLNGDSWISPVAAARPSPP